MSKEITGALFKQMILHGAAAITAQKQAINDLNVFPVPDGDTGTNMSMTIGTAVTELRKSEPATVEQAASVTPPPAAGARGNSGVILSLLFRGLSKALKGRETADAAAFAAAMQEGVSAAYKAVMKPAEGTVLTVSRLAAKQAVDTAAAGETDLERVLEDAIRVGYAALAQTTEMNPVLKKAGVVDAGGKGFLVILQGMLDELRGEPMPAGTEDEAPSKVQEHADFGTFKTEDIKFGYCTEFICSRDSKKDPEASGSSSATGRLPGAGGRRRDHQGPRPHQPPRQGAGGGHHLRLAPDREDRKHAQSAHRDPGGGRRPSRRTGGGAQGGPPGEEIRLRLRLRRRRHQRRVPDLGWTASSPADRP